MVPSDGTSRYPLGKNLDPYLTSHTKLKLKWLVDPNIKAKFIY